MLYGGQGDDLAYGNVAADVIYGNLGGDTMFAGQGDDTLFGGQGDDWLGGNLGSDILWGGAGNDTLAGSNGADIFVLQTGGGADVVVDFNGESGDRIGQLSSTPWSITDGVGGAVVAFGGDQMTLLNVRASDIRPDWFVTIPAVS